MIASMLAADNRTVGLYTSPHLVHLEERFQVNGTPCTPAELIELVEAVRMAAEEVEAMGEGAPTFFELTTAMAMEYFRRKQCEVSVIEVGLGGRLDSTNVCDPVVSVITHVGLDHQHILGDTVEKIAVEKAGIIKPGVPIVSGVRSLAAAAVIAAAAQERAAPLWQIGRDFEVHPRTGPKGEHPKGTGSKGTRHTNCFDFHSHSPGLHDRQDWSVSLEGNHQLGNAAVALAVMDCLEPIRLGASAAAQRQGLATLACQARIERFCEKPEIILDAAHNVDSIGALCMVLLNRPAKGKTVVVFGTSADKDAGNMLAMLANVADTMILTRYWSNPRWYDPAALAEMARNDDTIIHAQPLDALDAAIRLAGIDGQVVICGSFFLAAELRPVLLQRK